jgi:hypothetical protein
MENLQGFLCFNTKIAMDLRVVVSMLKDQLSDFQTLRDLLPDLLRMLIALIKQSLYQETRVVLYPDVTVLFIAIKQFVEESSLAQFDIQDVCSKISAVRAHLVGTECITCFEKIGISECCSFHKMCGICGILICNECCLSWSVCLQKEKKLQSCPGCRSHDFGQSLQDRLNSNAIQWAAIVFAIIFGEDFKTSFLSQQEKLQHGFPDLSVLEDMLKFLRRKLWDLQFSQSENRQIQCISFRGSVVDSSVANGSADKDFADGTAADGSADDGFFADGSAGNNIYD